MSTIPISASDQPLSSALERLRAMDATLLLLRASVLVLLANSNDDPRIFAAVALASLVALSNPRVLRSPWFWTAAFVGVGARQLATWHTIDDHIVVTTYWCGAIALGLTATDPARTLATSARFLIGALFSFAAGWKIRSGEFLDGSFFRHSLLFDERFDVVARVVGGTSRASLDANVGNVDALIGGAGTGEVLLREGSRNTEIARIFTWWGVMIECAVAITFLLPLREPWGWLRHATLFAFAVTTYLVVPIGGFGVLLLVLGAAMADDERLRIGCYVVAAGLALWAGVWPLLFL